MKHRHEQPPLPDVIAAIGEPPEPRSWPTEDESGWQMKLAARRDIIEGKLKTREEAVTRFKERVAWIASMKGVISLTTATVWIRIAKQYLRSALKYFTESEQIKENFKE